MLNRKLALHFDFKTVDITRLFSGIIIGELTLLCIYLQDTSGSRAKDHPVVSSPVPITAAPAAAAAAAHGKLLVLTHPSVLSSCICKIAVFFLQYILILMLLPPPPYFLL